MDGIEPWDVLGARDVAECRIFRVSAVDARHPRTRGIRQFYVLESPDWVNVIPVTQDGHVVLIEQYRHGTRETTLEIPGGMVEPGEEPLAAGLRELREETGHEGRGRLLGYCHPNPAIQDNRCWTVLVEHARRIGDPSPDEGEDIRVRLEPLTAVPELIATGRIRHALVIAAFHRLGLER